jgi:type IV pilus assembly protein PilW
VAFDTEHDKSPNNSDKITVRYAKSSNAMSVASVPNTNSANLKITNGGAVAPGDILMVTDCESTDIFQVTNVQGQGGGNNASTGPRIDSRWASVLDMAVATVIGSAEAGNGNNNGNNNGDSTTVVHNTGGDWSPGNANTGLSKAYPEGSDVVQFQTVEYELVQSGNSFDLQRTVGDNNSSIIATGVRDLQIEYGFDVCEQATAPVCEGQDGFVEYYSAGGAGTVDAEIASVRLQLLVESQNEDIVTDQQTITFNGSPESIPNGRLAQQFTATIAVRNRLP